MSTHSAIWNLSGDIDPTSVATNAPIGAQYSNTVTGSLYIKTGPGGTDWVLVPAPLPPLAVIFDNAVDISQGNIRSDRTSSQSPIDNTKSRITNLGSQDHVTNPAATGATGVGSTIGGGNDNTASGDYSTVPGGRGTSARGTNSYADSAGDAGGANSHADSGGFINPTDNDNSHADSGGYIDANTGQPGAQNSHADSGGYMFPDAGNSDFGTARSHADSSGFIGGYISHADSGGSANSDGCHADSSGQVNRPASHLISGANGAHADSGGSVGDGLTNATGQGSHADSGAHCEGGQSHACAAGAVIGTFADGVYGAFSAGPGSKSTASFCSSIGYYAAAIRGGQHACASGPMAIDQFSDPAQFFDPGTAQFSRLVMRGRTSGLAANQATELLFAGPAGFGSGANQGNKQLILEDNKTYAFKVTAAIGGIQAGPVSKSRTIEIAFNARREAGLTVITGNGAGAAYGDAATATWTLVASVGAGPDRIVLTFNTGAGAASKCHVAANVEFTEALYQ